MRAINIAIENPAFSRRSSERRALTALALTTDAPRGWIAASLALHAVTIGVTVTASVPLNNALADRGAWTAFAEPWIGWNHVRTVSGADHPK